MSEVDSGSIEAVIRSLAEPHRSEMQGLWDAYRELRRHMKAASAAVSEILDRSMVAPVAPEFDWFLRSR